MKKSSSFTQQILQAQKTVDSWSDSRISTLRLEGSDIFLNRRSSSQLSHQQSGVNNQKKK
jgi:hypothetical protein